MSNAGGDSGALDLLHPRVRELVDERGWNLTPVQEAATTDLVAGKDRILVAPTGSGKTEAAVLPLASRALAEEWDGLSILYITPLRALNRDIDRRLAKLLEPLGLSVGLRHGDTSQKERTKQSKKPPNLLVTTPETAQIMLLGSRLRQHLAGVKAVVLDEVHDMAASERGAQLLIGLERISGLENARGRFQRIGLSATVGNPAEVARWMSADAEPIFGPAPRTTKVIVHRETPTPEDELLAGEWSISPKSIAAFRHLAHTLIEDPPSLVFVNSRSSAETVAQRLSAIVPEIEVGVHHGSLAAETRREMEEALRAGKIHGLICTSSLELGIDIGAIRRVHQLNSPRAVDRMLQRVGRAEHHLGGTGRGDVLAWEIDDIAECAVIARRAMAGELEGVEWRYEPAIVAANQFLQMAAERSVVPLSQATELLNRSTIFPNWKEEDTLAVLRILDDRWLVRLIDKPLQSDATLWHPKLWEGLAKKANADARPADLVPEKRPPWDEKHSDGDKSRWRRAMGPHLPETLAEGWFSPAGKLGRNRTDHISMIPDEISYRVRDAVTRQSLGSVDEAFVLSLSDTGQDDAGRPRRFVMAGRTWMIVDADPEQNELLVAPVKDTGEAPVWSGELPPVPIEVALEVGRLRRSAAVAIGALEAQPKDLDYDEYPLSNEARTDLLNTVAQHLDATEYLPTDTTLTVEMREKAIVLNTCRGSRINETLAHFIQAMGSMREGKMGTTLIDPYRIAFQVPGTTVGHVIEWLTETSPEALETILRMTIPNGRALRWRIVQVARKMGVLEKAVDPRRVNLQGLMQRYRGTPVVEEALSKLFHERMDIEGTMDLIREIQSGKVEVIHTASGPLGLSPKSERDLLLPAWSDAQLRERLETRLVAERAVLICLNCQDKTRKRVGRMEDRIEPCPKCSGTMRACAPERMESMLAGWVASEDPKERARMKKNAELIRTHGHDAVLALMGRGVGEETATRLLRGHTRGNRVKLLRAIHNAELQYARTRRYWS
ncbi:MAG: DEAD/DEAH box helicase [Candidatus Thalassarchaeaceae archaeon]|jgi:ATP-dependent Lhr-like helicase|nr:DEAD/DEAH box helicase [Candidatus Thalassarchaeaceae archaeon]